MVVLKFASSHNMVAFLDKPTESDGFEQIVDFLNAHSIKYALMVNPTIYTSCIEQFWTTAKVKTVNEEVQIQALVDKKKVIVTETSVRSDLQLEDAEGTECLPNTTIFEQLTLMGYENLTQKLTFYKAFFSPQWKFLIHTILQCLSAKTTAWNEFSSTMASAVICLATNQKFNFSKYIFDNMVKNLEGGVKFLMYPRFVQVFLNKQVEGMAKHKKIYVTPSHTKKVFANMKRQGKDFSGRDTPLFPTMIVQAQEQEGEGSVMPTVPQHTPTINPPSTSKPQKKQSRRKQRKDTKVSQPSNPTEPMTYETENVESVPTHSNDLLFSGEDRLQLKELLELCTKLSERVLDLENTKTSQAAKITKLKERVKKSTQVVSSKDEGLGAQEDAFKQGRKIVDLDADADVTLVDEAQGRNDDYLMFDTRVFDEHEVEVEKAVSTAEVTTVSATTTTIDELTLAQTLIEIKAAKPKEELTVEQKSKLFVELKDKRKKHFARLREKEQRRIPPTKAQRRNQICSYLKNMALFTQSQLKNKSIDEVQNAFNKTMGWIDSFVSMDFEVVKGGKEKDECSVARAEESSSKIACKELEQERIKKKKIDDDQEEAEMKKHIKIVVDEKEIEVDAIPLATKPQIIVDWNIIKEGKMEYFQLIRAYGSSRRYSSIIKMF
ncbi:hypothetical protein Tco_1509352 [Tanacetum coccineum]